MSVALVVPVASAKRTCLVCAEPTNVTRLGIDSCRACASFFERASTARRKLVCRQGDKKCSTRKHDKFACRSCRYDKCRELGMKYVQRCTKIPLQESVDAEVPSTSCSPELPQGIKGIKGESIILRMETEYKASYERRIVKEKEYVASNNLPRFSHPSEELFVASFSVLYDLFRIAIEDSISLLQTVIDEFADFPIVHQEKLFKKFMSNFCMTECLYYSNKYFKRSEGKFMASLLTCADFHNLNEWITEHDSDKHGIVKKDAFQTTLKGYANEYIELFDTMAKIEQLTEREFYALLVLNYCDVDTLDLPEEIIQSTQKTRAIVFRELQDYYRNELKLRDCSKRLGNLMTLAQGAREAGNLMNEEMRLYATIFDLHTDDKLFREFFAK